MSLIHRNTHRRLLSILALLILLVAAGGCQEDPAPAGEVAPTTPAVAAGAVYAEGRVVPVAETTLAFPFAGEVGTVPVAEGETVTEDQPLAQLVVEEQQATLAEAEAGVAQAEANVAAARADLAAAEAGVEAAEQAVALTEAARAVLVAPPPAQRLEVAESAVAAAAATIEEAAGERDQVVEAATAAELAAARARLTAAETNLFVVRIQNESITQDPDEPADERERAQLRLNAAIADVNAAQAALDRLQQGVTTAERRAAASGVGRAAAERDVAAAERDQVVAGPQPETVAVADARIASAENQVEAAETQLDLAANAISRAEAELAAAEAARDAAASALRRATISAPFAGTVADIQVAVGETVAAGQPALTIADLSAWEVETTDLTELQVGDFTVGSAVAVLVDGLPDQVLSGEVVAVAPTAEVVRGDVTYRATVALDAPDSLPLRWGMTVLVAPAEGADELPAAAAQADVAPLAIAAAVAPARDATLGVSSGGTVAKVAVAEGETVTAGEPLLALESDELQSALQQAQAMLASAEAAYQSALAGVAAAEAAVSVAEGEVAVAQAEYEQVLAGPSAQAVAAAESRLAAAQSALSGAAAARDALVEEPGIDAQVEAARSELSTATAELRQLEEQYDDIIDTCFDTPDGEVCPLYGPVEETTRAQVEAARARVDAAQARVAELEDGPTSAQLRAASGRVGAAAANRDLAQAQLALLQAGATEEQLRQAEVAVAAAEAQVAVAEARVARAEAAAAQAEAGVQAAEAGVAQAEAALAQATVHAPFAGFVASLDVNRGELVGAGQPLVTVAAQPWQVETTELTELDVANVAPGDEVRVRFDALPDVELGGTVERVALTAQNRNGDVVYTAVITLEDSDELPLRWGMSAEVDFTE